MFGLSSNTWAVDSYLGIFNDTYGTANTVLDSCLVCHVTANGGTRNDYGTSFETAKAAAGGDVAAALAAIESIDSDGDGLLNIDEIIGLTFPGDCTDPDPTACGGTGDPGTIPPGTVTEGPTMLACYKWDRFPNERFALSIKRYGGLVTTEPRNDYIESQLQTNHGVHGKHVGACGPNTIALNDGTFLKAKGIGSHLGIQSYASRGDGELGGDEWCRSIVLDCISEEDVQVPKEFKCRSRNEFDLYHGESQLKLVENSVSDPLCNAFEDDMSTSPAGRGSASGLQSSRGGRNDD
jgi:hypothetical protein